MVEAKFFVHPNALVESSTIGKGTRIWAFAHVMEGAVIGEGCNIGDHSFVESDVILGNDVTVKNGVSIWSGVVIEAKVFVGPNVAFTNDLFPRSKVYHEQNVETLVKAGASIGANATIVAGVVLGSYSMIGAGAVVTHSVRDYELVAGVPARHLGWVGQSGNRLEFVKDIATEGQLSYRLTLKDGIETVSVQTNF